MLTLLSYVGYVKRPGGGQYLAVFLFFVMGMMAKPMLVTLPFVLLLLDYWPLGRFEVSATGVGVSIVAEKKKIIYLIWEKTPFFIVVIISSVMTFLTQQEGDAVKSLADYPMAIRIANALVAYAVYIGKMFWPARLAFFYPYPGALPFWQAASAAIFLVLISVAAIKTIRRHPYVAIGWLWYLGTLLPVIGLVVIGPYVIADRYTYIPLIGIFVAIAWGVPDMLPVRPYKQVMLASAAIIILASLSFVSWRQVQHWQNSVTLCKHAIGVTQKNLTAYNNLGVALDEKGRTGEAVKYYLESL